MQTFIIVTLMALTLASASPLDLGRGGVYNSPAAQEYWNRRFGSGFLSNLASIQRGINARASRNKANLEVANVPEAAIVEEDIEAGNEIARSAVKMSQPPPLLTIQPGPLFFGQVHF